MPTEQVPATKKEGFVTNSPNSKQGVGWFNNGLHHTPPKLFWTHYNLGDMRQTHQICTFHWPSQQVFNT